MDDNDHLDDAFTDLLGARRVTIADEDATYHRVVERAYRRIARRRVAGATLTLALVGAGAATIAIATHPGGGRVAVQGAPTTTTASTSTTTTTNPWQAPLTSVPATPKGRLGIEVEKGGTVVVGTVTGSPAERAGIAPGDRIVSINGHSTDDASAITLALEPAHAGQVLRITWKDKQGHDHAASVQLAP